MNGDGSRAARRAMLALALALLAGCAGSPARQGYVERLELLALLQTLNADLLSHDSATLTLERWCAAHRLAEPARVVARRVLDASKPIPPELRAALALGPDEPLAYRRVQLVCGIHVLSEADNWYVPGRLTAQMNRQLDETDLPFGKVVKPLGLQRHTVSAQLLWSPLPSGWEMSARSDDGTPLRLPPALLQHTAILSTARHEPFSAVVETYSSELFAFVRAAPAKR